jgi:hypothetical protein
MPRGAAAPGRSDAHCQDRAKAFENCRFGFERCLGRGMPRIVRGLVGLFAGGRWEAAAAKEADA